MKRNRSLGLLLVAIGILALAVPGMAAAAKQRDRNHDGIPDRWEKRHRLSTKVNQARRDQDRDHLRNRAEFRANTDPRDPDTDDDGISDSDENAGTIASFDPASGKLVIDLFGGETVSGLVTDETEIECDDRHSGASASHADDEDESSDDQESEGPGEDGDDQDQPDDDGEEQEEPGEDEGGSNCTTADLEAGAVVHEAELELENGRATFEKVELAG